MLVREWAVSKSWRKADSWWYLDCGSSELRSALVRFLKRGGHGVVPARAIEAQHFRAQLEVVAGSPWSKVSG